MLVHHVDVMRADGNLMGEAERLATGWLRFQLDVLGVPWLGADVDVALVVHVAAWL